MKNAKIKVLKGEVPIEDVEELPLTQLNHVYGGKKWCINYYIDIVGDCYIVHCGIRWGS